MSSIESRMRAKLVEALKPLRLDLENESHKHGFSRGPEGHFKLLVVADVFAGLKTLERHQKIYSLLKTEMADGVHALAIKALSPAEAEANQISFETPACQHKH